MADGTPSRRRILEAAIDQITEGGEAAFRLDVVAETAGVTKPSIYHFFGSRDGLVAAAQAERFRRTIVHGLDTISEAARTTRTRADFEAILEVMLDITTDPAASGRRAERIQILGSAVSRPELTDQVVAALRDAVAQSREFAATPAERGWPTGELHTDTMILWWFGIVLGRHLFDIAADERMDEQWRRFTRRMLQQAIFGDA